MADIRVHRARVRRIGCEALVISEQRCCLASHDNVVANDAPVAKGAVAHGQRHHTIE